ncbi:uncharacterized protein SAPINGB_P005796 [Magnusiomyces paraingens]|uniref:Zinc finger C2H2 LYAR-type domain-containing protein n=1 Tax=Magnusiomyces paraingens TaxID=2606893 RepID=A0A5E8C3P1_9ASCO|nr:uncharacterized protein SAPINGB_P005796 [Saprochaete ingens]VVT57640.1 unnamed protein product [Saprochaete ingens]
MVSFSCEVCNETLIKKKVRNHYCRNAAFTCLDCNKTFYGNDYNAHNQCISEAQKYEKSLYNPKKKNGRQNQNQNNQTKPNEESKPEPKQEPKPEPKKETKTEPKPEPKKETKTEPKKEDSKKDNKKESTDLLDFIKGPTDLYKIVKKLEKTTKKDKKEILKGLTAEKLADGSIILKPSA